MDSPKRGVNAADVGMVKESGAEADSDECLKGEALFTPELQQEEVWRYGKSMASLTSSKSLYELRRVHFAFPLYFRAAQGGFPF